MAEPFFLYKVKILRQTFLWSIGRVFFLPGIRFAGLIFPDSD